MEGLNRSFSSLHLVQQTHNYYWFKPFYHILWLSKICNLLPNIFLIINSILRTSFYNIQFGLVLFLLLLQCGDIEVNPGPVNATYDVSILHLNIRSIRNKMEFIAENFLDFDSLCFTETHLDINVSEEMLFLSNNYSTPYRIDRTNHGGACLHIYDQVYFTTVDQILKSTAMSQFR